MPDPGVLNPFLLSLRVVLLAAAIHLLLIGNTSAAGVTSEGTEALHAAQAAFERKQYDRALSLLEPLTKGGIGSREALTLQIRSLLRLGRPSDALGDYERLETQSKQENRPLLREVAIGFITPLLKDMREQMRGAAYTALKELDSKEAIPHFEDGLSDGSGLVRALAVEGLGRLAAGRRSARLRQAVEDQAAMVRTAALKALGRSNDRSVIPLLEHALADEQPGVRVTAWGALATMGRREAWDQVRDAAARPNPDERSAALRVLGSLRDRRALPVLQEALGDPQPSVRGAAAIALGELGRPEASPGLSALLLDPVPAVRASAATSLGELESRASTPALKQALADSNPAVRAAAVSALLRVGEPYADVADVIRGLTQGQDPGIRAAAARALASARPRRGKGSPAKEATDTLRLLLDDPLPRTRIAAARALGQIGGTQVVPILKKALRDSDEAVRATAGGALGRTLGLAPGSTPG